MIGRSGVGAGRIGGGIVGVVGGVCNAGGMVRKTLRTSLGRGRIAVFGGQIILDSPSSAFTHTPCARKRVFLRLSLTPSALST